MNPAGERRQKIDCVKEVEAHLAKLAGLLNESLKIVWDMNHPPLYDVTDETAEKMARSLAAMRDELHKTEDEFYSAFEFGHLAENK